LISGFLGNVLPRLARRAGVSDLEGAEELEILGYDDVEGSDNG
jgi:hypothetical protein